MTLHWGAKFIEECIPPDLRAGLNEGICCDPFYEGKDLTLPHYNAQSGEKLFDMPGEVSSTAVEGSGHGHCRY